MESTAVAAAVAPAVTAPQAGLAAAERGVRAELPAGPTKRRREPSPGRAAECRAAGAAARRTEPGADRAHSMATATRCHERGQPAARPPGPQRPEWPKWELPLVQRAVEGRPDRPLPRRGRAAARSGSPRLRLLL